MKYKYSRKKVQHLCECLLVVCAGKNTLVPPVHQDISDLLHSLVFTELNSLVVSLRIIGGLDDHQHDSISLQL